ncbi:MAG TPA: AMP-binding protein, partial [Deinococcales bacterium]|nr:AMP-binding protein [Deinococcales bacterium]
MSDARIESVLHESRSFEPPADFAARARVSREQYERDYRRSLDDPDGFWREVAGEFHWFRDFERVLDWVEPHATWFPGGETNLSYNCLDRHLTERGDKTAILWEGEPGDVRRVTYRELHGEVCRFANVLKGLGVQRGDRVTIYLPMVPEAAVAMLACARIGATHSVVFGGFSAGALADRISDAQSKVLITADGSFRRGAIVPLKGNADEAIGLAPIVEQVVVLRRSGHKVEWTPGRDRWWHELMAEASPDCPAEPLPSDHPLFILYTSGSTGKPKGVLHATGGYMVWTAFTARNVFDLRDDDTYFCTADVGWVTGHSYVLYGILANGATTLMYEGAPNYPNPDRIWE